MRTESVRMYVMRPTAPSSPRSTPSYSCWATVIVFLAENPSLRPASCWSVEVMNGGAGLRRRSPRVTDRTTNGRPSRPAMSARVSASLVSDAFSPRTSRSVASNCGGRLPVSRACSDQYSTGTKASISRSRSTISRTATDCTRPADSPRRTLSHSSGDRL